MARQEVTTKLCIYNITDNNIVIVSNKQTLADYLNTSRETVVNWFRNGVNVVRKEHNGCDYIIYEADYYIKKDHPGGGTFNK